MENILQHLYDANDENIFESPYIYELTFYTGRVAVEK